MILNFDSPLTVARLKELVKDLPEVNSETGEPFVVWIGDGNGLTNPVKSFSSLNVTESGSDILLESAVHD